MSPPTDTRNRLLDAARELFHRHGYESTSLAAVAEKAEANPGSLYYFFKTKEELLLAVLGRYRELLHPVILEPAFERSEDPIERIFHVLDGYREMLNVTDCGVGCPIGNLALEMTEPSPEVREGIAANFEGWCAGIEACLEAARDRLPEHVDRAKLSRFVLTVMEGAVLQARGRGTIEPFDEAVFQLRGLFQRLEGEAARSRRSSPEPAAGSSGPRTKETDR